MHARSVAAFLLALGLTAAAQSTPPSGTSSSQAQTPAAQAPAGPPAQPAGTKRPPEARDDKEYSAYKAILAQTNPAAAEQAAKDFEARFAASELRALVYYNVMHRYQEANNGDKMIEMGRKAVQLDPDNPLYLIEVANVIAEGTRDSDVDRDARYAEAAKDAQRGLQTVGTALVVAPGTSDQTVQQNKQLLTALAHAALGLVDFNRHNDASAEQHLKQAALLNTVQPDPMVYLRLAIAQDHQNKYAEALQSANKAIALAPAGDIGDLARREKDRLEKLLGSSAPAAAPTPRPATPPPPAAPEKPKN